MPQLGNMKFPYTKAGKARYQQIKKALGNTKVTRPINGVKPRPIGKRPSGSGLGRPAGKKPIWISPRPAGGKRPKPPAGKKFL